ncbi:hypothetical protein [Flavobacterium psychrotrophum]|uniref:hypothetical protein n=1 Tax=Flavobacterium psychrotrophum TaxID=2294119 RepID=UPI0013C3F5B8|nr:hypothetical protein [Flavobacterium psychrotrophum]
MRNNVFYFLFFISISMPAFGQVFITIDKDTHEFIEDVSYSLFKNKKVVHSAITLSDKVTAISPDVVFDSITLSRVDYETLGVSKQHMDSVFYLTKKIFYLDEVVIGSGNKKEILLGEANRFVKRKSSKIQNELVYGLIFFNGTPQDYVLDKLAFYVEKVKVRTAYKVNFNSVDEEYVHEGFQLAKPGELIFSTDTLYLNSTDKNKIEVALPNDFHLPSTKKMFVWIQLIGYYDENGRKYTPELDRQTKIKFQMSNQTNYYSRMADGYKKDGTTDFIANMNAMYNYEYAYRFFSTPPKSALVAPAIVLYAHKPQSKPVEMQKKTE